MGWICHNIAYMRRLLAAVSVVSWFAGASAEASSSAPAVPPPAVSITVAPSRIAEARALVPPPLLHARFQPVVGTWVEYEYRSKEARFPVRVAVVGMKIGRASCRERVL